ncbi:unnamed protein product [Effrenium voratum]|nr:unnamed protein product [Effrenium voratum]
MPVGHTFQAHERHEMRYMSLRLEGVTAVLSKDSNVGLCGLGLGNGGLLAYHDGSLEALAARLETALSRVGLELKGEACVQLRPVEGKTRRMGMRQELDCMMTVHDIRLTDGLKLRAGWEASLVKRRMGMRQELDCMMTVHDIRLTDGLKLRAGWEASLVKRWELTEPDGNCTKLPRGLGPFCSPLAAAAELLSGGQVLAFTGAGISKESGVPTYRDGDGLWTRYDAMEVSSLAGLAGEPAKAMGGQGDKGCKCNLVLEQLVWAFEREFNEILSKGKLSVGYRRADAAGDLARGFAHRHAGSGAAAMTCKEMFGTFAARSVPIWRRFATKVTLGRRQVRDDSQASAAALMPTSGTALSRSRESTRRAARPANNAAARGGGQVCA